MRQNMLLALAGAGIVTMALLAGAPARSADAPPVAASGLLVMHPESPVDAPMWRDVDADKAPLVDRQRMTDRVEVMARQLRRDAGADHPGEDTLGSGTSLTH